MNRFRRAWKAFWNEPTGATNVSDPNSLVAQLRFMDEKVYLMTQSLDPNEFRKHFAPAAEAMMKRKKTESDRIAAIVIPQIEATYGREK